MGRSWTGDIGYKGNSFLYSNSNSSGQPWTCHFNSLFSPPSHYSLNDDALLPYPFLPHLLEQELLGKEVTGSCLQKHSLALRGHRRRWSWLHQQQEGAWHSCVTTRAHTARFTAPATVQTERQQAITTLCTLNYLKEVIAIHNLNLMVIEEKWN